MYKIAVIGDNESIMGFSALGLSVFPADTAEEAVKLLKQLDDGKFAVIYITEKLASLIPSVMEKFKQMSVPVVIQIPGLVGNTGDGIKDLHACVEKAGGSDILLNMK